MAPSRRLTTIRKLRITVLDIIPQGPATSLWARLMNANMASIMAPVVALWCEQAGHEVEFLAYTGFEEIDTELLDRDLVFIGSFTRSALLAYAISAICRRRGAVTVLGGPHARCYPDDAASYFDFVLGMTDRSIIHEVLQSAEPQRPVGVMLSAPKQPETLPLLQERWKFIEPTLAKAPVVKLVPMLGSLGCPYTCSFCIDSEIDYQPLGFDRLQADLRFLLTKFKRPRVGWHDPNFGIRFDDYLDAIEEAVPPGAVDHVAESSLAILTEPRLERLQRAGFKGILPGIESWFGLGGKSKTGTIVGEDKVRRVAEHVNMIARYIPYIQTNFILGLDVDEGAAPFALTKHFLDLCPSVFPAYSMLTAFGEATPLNLELQREGRVLPFPFHFLDNNQSMNVRPLNYTWPEFYDRLIDLSEYSFSWRAIGARLRAQGIGLPGMMNVARAISSEGFGRVRYHTMIRGLLDTDLQVRAFFDGETTTVPQFYVDRIRTKLGPYWEALPEEALVHDPNAFAAKHSLAMRSAS